MASPTREKIVNFLLNNEADMSEREISRLLGVSHMSVNRTMRELEEMNFAQVVRAGRVHLWRINRESYAFRVFSLLSEVLSNIKPPLEDLKTTILDNVPLALISELILFGSIAKSAGKSSSDIDLFVLVENEDRKSEIEPALAKLGELCLTRFGNLLSPYVLTRRDLDYKSNLRLLTDIKNGIRLFPPKKQE